MKLERLNQDNQNSINVQNTEAERHSDVIQTWVVEDELQWDLPRGVF